MPAQGKKIIKKTKKTVLIVGEGPTEKAFLRYVKELYITRDMDISVSIVCGSGGSPRNVVEKAVRLCGSIEYDKCFVLIDADIPFNADKKLLSRMKKRPRIEILKATPCIEGLLLAILGRARAMPSDDCKSTFEAQCIASNKKTAKRSYERLFSKEILDEKRHDLNGLDIILKAMGV